MPVNKKYFDDLMKDRQISLRAIARQSMKVDWVRRIYFTQHA